ncbi:MAG: hypothetical protein KDD33_05095 [Bdellovibrionales bacterium]|nr:hypothetical protein [Bdellovibrionales bacterium]
MILSSLFLLLFSAQGATYAPNQCKTFAITKGDHGSGELKYCDDGTHQQLYVSGDMDVGDDDSIDCVDNARHRRSRDCRDYRSVQAVKKLFKKRDKGTFELITEGAGGGEVSWHQSLIMKLEDSCTKDCRITTKIRGKCESACAQLHITCVKHAKSYFEPGGEYCEHASNDSVSCKLCDPKAPKDPCEICPPAESMADYTDRCDKKKLLKGRKLSIDPKKVRQVSDFAKKLKDDGIFSTDTFTCVTPPWFELEPTGTTPSLDGEPSKK